MSGSRTVVFRLDLGRRTGWGHLARCAALADALRARGWQCVLWSDGDLAEAPPDLRFAYQQVVPAGPTWIEQPPAVVLSADWVVVDDYGVDDPSLRRLGRALGGRNHDHGPKLLVLDDEGRRRLDAASLVLNSRLGLEKSFYAPDVPALLGERYALLRSGLATPHAITPPFPADAEAVLVMLGGTDPRGLTAQVLEAIADVDPVRFCPVVVHAQQSPEAVAVRTALDRFATSAWLEGLGASALAGWAQSCRYAVSAAGGTLYELALFHLPFVAIVVAENQRAFANEVRQRWEMPVVDVDGSVRQSVSEAFRALTQFFPGGPMGARTLSHIDGKGAARVADALEAR